MGSQRGISASIRGRPIRASALRRSCPRAPPLARIERGFSRRVRGSVNHHPSGRGRHGSRSASGKALDLILPCGCPTRYANSDTSGLCRGSRDFISLWSTRIDVPSAETCIWRIRSIRRSRQSCRSRCCRKVTCFIRNAFSTGWSACNPSAYCGARSIRRSARNFQAVGNDQTDGARVDSAARRGLVYCR
jgi:hypothetical protein